MAARKKYNQQQQKKKYLLVAWNSIDERERMRFFDILYIYNIFVEGIVTRWILSIRYKKATKEIHVAHRFAAIEQREKDEEKKTTFKHNMRRLVGEL